MAALGLAAAAAPLPAGLAQASGEGGGGKLHLVHMEEVIVPIVDADHMAGSLRFKLVLDAGTIESEALLLRDMPMLRAATVAAGLEFARLNASGLRAVDVERLDHDLTAAIKATDPGVVRVLIVEVAASGR
nr:hypothetical protein [Sphingomonas sp. dw_22]